MNVKLRFGEQGFQCFLPKRKKLVIRSRKPVPSQEAFFPTYIFVAFDPNRDRWLSINNTMGMRSLIMIGERPVPVPHGIVEQLQAMADEEGCLCFGSDLDIGDRIRIVDGHFAELMGCVSRLEGKHRVLVLIEMMHGRLPVNLPRGSVARTDP